LKKKKTTLNFLKNTAESEFRQRTERKKKKTPQIP
jgi:hypothetical protein